MAIIFEGDASLTAQIDTLTPGGTIEVGDEFDSILTAEDNSTVQTEKYIATSTSVQSVVEGVQAQLAASTKSLFQVITWTENDLVVTATAKVAGVPFYLTEATFESGGGAADQQTYAQATTTANSGPNDWNAGANWSGGSKPGAQEDVIIAGTNVDIKYGLNQSGVDIDSLSIAPSYGGEIGDSVNKYYLQINVSNASPQLVIINNVNGRPIWLKGRLDKINIVGTSRELNAVQLDLDAGTSEIVRISGAQVLGTITVKSSSSLTSLYMNDCPGAKGVLGTSLSGLTLIEMSSGTLTNDSLCTTINVAGGNYKHTAGAVSTLTLRGGVVDYRGAGTITALLIQTGHFDLDNLEVVSLTITNTTLWGGLLTERNGLNNVTYSNPILAHGGTVISPTADVNAF